MLKFSSKNFTDIAMYFIKNADTIGLDVNVTSNKGKTALHFAIKQGNLEIVTALLDRKDINIHMSNVERKTPTPLGLHLEKSPRGGMRAVNENSTYFKIWSRLKKAGGYSEYERSTFLIKSLKLYKMQANINTKLNDK